MPCNNLPTPVDRLSWLDLAVQDRPEPTHDLFSVLLQANFKFDGSHGIQCTLPSVTTFAATLRPVINNATHLGIVHALQDAFQNYSLPLLRQHRFAHLFNSVDLQHNLNGNPESLPSNLPATLDLAKPNPGVATSDVIVSGVVTATPATPQSAEITLHCSTTTTELDFAKNG
ncbi:hypothetical protein SERLA73DRAFT_76891 [Serpula lacrymans var. lacrymans S7.3]|uniref:Uncharacterized protein n=1 Tax=Serpula lacrymans var. lacrymans (strain S7.3) TaxID=936435 RepID=F8Q8E9_SERL3|nr:hypothetical protein SERLA73DRAFT_76891 [Serpula lacrymans var. lacrymans S7.3]